MQVMWSLLPTILRVYIALREYIEMCEIYSLIFRAVTQTHYPVSSQPPLIMQNQTRQWN